MAFEELKARQSVIWGKGPYQRISETITDIHELVVDRLEPGPGVRWLDLACGTGAVAERAAAVGASVVGVDLAPALIETAKDRARERARVTRPGGRIALANWTPGPGVADLFRIMLPFQPAPPPSSPFDWGDESRVRELLGEAFDLQFEKHVSTLELESGEEYWQLFATSYGPTKTLYESLGDRGEELRSSWVDFFEQNHREDGRVVHRREYLLVL